MGKFKLSLLVEAFMKISTFDTIFINKKNKSILEISELMSDEEKDELFNLVDEKAEDYIKLPLSHELDKYGMMTRFIDSLENEEYKEVLSKAIRGKGVYRRFKETIESFKLKRKWFLFKKKEYILLAKRFAVDNKIDYIDDYDDSSKEIMKRKIALGCMRISNMSVDELEELVLCAVDNDITLFDHADIYGNRKSEELFGYVLEKNPGLRERIIIQSKCGICKGYYDLSKEHIIKQVVESIRLLKCGYLDILLLHRPDVLVDYQEVNSAFHYLYRNGLVRSFGLSNMNPYQIELYKKFIDFDIKYNQIQFSVVHSHIINQGLFVNMSDNEAIDHSSGLLEYCMLNNIEIQAWSSLMASWEDGSFIDNPKYAKLNEKLKELSEKYNVSKNAIAIAWILRHPANIVPIVGTTSKKHLLEIVKAIDIVLTKEEWYMLYLASGHYLP